MTPDMSRRCGLALFLALSIAAAAGLIALPALDPVAAWQPWLGLWLPGAALSVAAAAGGRYTLHQLARRVHPTWGASPLRALLWLGWGVGSSAWLLGQLHATAGDGRLLLWLALTPLWLAAAGLWGGGAGRSPARRGATKGLPEQSLDGGVMNQVDVRRGADVARPSPGQQGVRSREDDIVAMAPDAEEQLAA